MPKPCCTACEKNKDPILNVLKTLLQDNSEVLEIGSGTGQHAVYFSQHLAHITWQPSDRESELAGIQMWLDEAQLKNVKTPIKLKVQDQPWPFNEMEAVFTANTLHIMSWQEDEILFQRLGKYLKRNGRFICYGPFNKNGTYTSEGNASFDQWLKERDPLSGIRDIEALVKTAIENNISLIDEIEMPANNKILVWQKD